MSGIRIEVLTEQRARELSEILLDMTKDSSWDDWTVANLLASRAGKWERSLIAYENDRPAGWAILSNTEHGVHLHHLVVAPDLRSRGIGELLVAEALQRNSDEKLMTLKVHPSNEGALRFYKRLGFNEAGTTATGYKELARETGRREPA